MKLYRKKPIVIEAEQWNYGDEPLPCMQPYEGRLLEQFPQYENFYYLETLEGIMHVSSGDYVIKGIQGEFYPCKPDIFKETYEEANVELNY